MKFWYKFVNKSLPEYCGTIFTFNNELYQIETCGQNQLHLFPTRTISARNVLRHHIAELLQKYPRAITQRDKAHSIESFVTLLKAYIFGSYSYECTDINYCSCKHNVRWFFTVLVAYTSIWWCDEVWVGCKGVFGYGAKVAKFHEKVRVPLWVTFDHR